MKANQKNSTFHKNEKTLVRIEAPASAFNLSTKQTHEVSKDEIK